MGLESINKASAATQSVQTTAPVTTNVQAAGSSAPESQESKATLADVKDISKVLNSNTVAEFGVYEPMNRITIKIKDKETGEVLKEIPSEKMLKMFTKACELAGLLVDEKM